MDTNDFFDRYFPLLAGNEPFPWQRELFRRFTASGSAWPTSCALPTGLGKTSVIAIWLLALIKHPDKMPRRLVYVVNRRTVVDQTTNEVLKIRENLSKLNGLPGCPAYLPVSTLRGQFADNREWSADPSRPAVISGTVDMIGSRLLFSGYGVGFKAKPLHAGFLGQDVLLVHDEAHLEPAFQDLLIAIQKEQKRSQELGTFRVMELSATSRDDGEPFRLTEMDHADPRVRKRIGATKDLRLHEVGDEKEQLADRIAALALKHRESGRAILVFARTVEDVERIVAKLKKEKQQVQQLTGTMRGLERDGLVRDSVFIRFFPSRDRPSDVTEAVGTVYLACTSAGEVGVNISADHLVCDLSTFESMAQRFGRVNRFGDCDDTEVHVVFPAQFGKDGKIEAIDDRRRNTLQLLKDLKGDASPNSLDRLSVEARLAAFAPTPIVLPVTDILFDAWALTTIRGDLAGRPRVEPYLHGLSVWEPPETLVAWREEVEVITGPLLDAYKPEDLLEDFPLKPHEVLRNTSTRVFERLRKLKASVDTPVWIIADNGSVVVKTLGEVIDAGKEELSYKTVVLPPGAGGLEGGMLVSDSRAANDVSEEWRDGEGTRRRIRLWDNDSQFDEKTEGMRLIRPPLDIQAGTEDDAESNGRQFWYWYEVPNEGDGEGSKSNSRPVLWQVHVDDVVRNATNMVATLPLARGLKQAVIAAAKFHDLGKRRTVFQRILGNFDPQILLAKSGKKGNRLPELYRHEFGSLLDVTDENEFTALDDEPELQELILHLIAAHHGRGRPHFPPEEAFDPGPKGKDANRIAAEGPRRFARLQRRFGRWGLAYLESLLRAADWAASGNPSAFVEAKT